MGTVLILDGWFRHEFSIKPALHHILLLHYKLFKTILLHSLYKIIYLKRLTYKEIKEFDARCNKGVEQFHHFTSLVKHCPFTEFF